MIGSRLAAAAERVVVNGLATAGAQPMTNMAIGPANRSTVVLLRPNWAIV